MSPFVLPNCPVCKRPSVLLVEQGEAGAMMCLTCAADARRAAAKPVIATHLVVPGEDGYAKLVPLERPVEIRISECVTPELEIEEA